MKRLEFKVGASQGGMRLDVYLVGAELGLSRRKIRQVIDVGGVYVNRKRIRIASRQVEAGDLVRVEYSEAALTKLKTEPRELQPEELILDAGDVLAINKPPGLPSQATKDQSVLHVVPCLAALLRGRNDGRAGRLVLVHRLDKETSGVLLLAATNKMATWLTAEFRARNVAKRYLAICYGVPAHDTFTERSPLSEIDKRTGDVRIVRSGGRSAVTHMRLLAANRELDVSLIECRPETGRSHQLRVHLEHCGLPIVGDKRYGAARPGLHSAKGLPAALAELTTLHHFLHAESLTFRPGEAADPCQVAAQPPQRFAQFLAAAGLAAGSAKKP